MFFLSDNRHLFAEEMYNEWVKYPHQVVGWSPLTGDRMGTYTTDEMVAEVVVAAADGAPVVFTLTEKSTVPEPEVRVWRRRRQLLCCFTEKAMFVRQNASIKSEGRTWPSGDPGPCHPFYRPYCHHLPLGAYVRYLLYKNGWCKSVIPEPQKECLLNKR